VLNEHRRSVVRPTAGDPVHACPAGVLFVVNASGVLGKESMFI